MIKLLQAIHPTKWIYVILPVVLLAAGILAGMTDSLVALAVLGLCAVVLVSFLSPMNLFLLWLFISPFTQSLLIPLGTNVPDISFDRVIFLLLLGKLLIRSLSTKSIGFRLKLEDGLLISFLIWVLFSILLWKRVDLPKQFVIMFEQFLFPLGIYWMVQQIATKESDLKKIFITATILIIVFCIPVLLEEIAGFTPFGKSTILLDGVVRAKSFLRSSWEFGAFAVMLFMYNLQHFTNKSIPKMKTASIFGFWFGVLGIAFCYMRGAWLAAAISTSFFFFFTKKLHKHFILGILLVSLAAIFFLPFLTTSEAWIKRIANPKNIYGRVNVANQQLNMIQEEPIFGNGLMPSFDKYIMTTDYYSWGSYDVLVISHNTLLSMLVDFGVFALLYFGAIGIILIKVITNYKYFPTDTFLGQGILLSLVATIVAFLINAMTFENRLFIFINAFAWMTLGLMNVVIRLNNERNSTDLTSLSPFEPISGENKCAN